MGPMSKRTVLGLSISFAFKYTSLPTSASPVEANMHVNLKHCCPDWLVWALLFYQYSPAPDTIVGILIPANTLFTGGSCSATVVHFGHSVWQVGGTMLQPFPDRHSTFS